MFGHKKGPASRAPERDKLGIYIHIPFCRSKCDYCDFYSLAGREDQMDRYQKALLAHLAETAPLAKGIPVDTVYFGGGTPSFYGDKRLRELLEAIEKWFDLDKGAEITLEANPDSVDFKALRRWVKSFRKVRRNRAAVLMAVHLDAHGSTIVIFLHDVADKLCFVDILHDIANPAV